MTDAKPSVPDSPSRRRARRLRQIGVLVLVLGLAAAGAVYWRGNRDADLGSKLSMQGFDRAERRQMGRLYGKSGQLIDEWADGLKQPATQAILISAASAAVFITCFYFARLLDFDEATE